MPAATPAIIASVRLRVSRGAVFIEGSFRMVPVGFLAV
jgi:hypothetical protein